MDEDSLVLVTESNKETREVEFKYSPGVKAKDVVTGISGTIINCILWINGCKHYSIQPKAKKGATKRPEIVTCDESDIKILGEMEQFVENRKSPGGPAQKSSSFRA